MAVKFHALAILLALGAEGYRTKHIEAEPIDCMSLSNFAGQCMVSVSPGACYIEDGVKNAEGDEVKWSCWGADDKFTDAQCKEKLGTDNKTVGYKGACTYGGYGAQKKDEDIQDCSDLGFHHTQCNRIWPWGACYVKGLSRSPKGLMCIPETNQEVIANFRKGDCTTTPTHPAVAEAAYTDVCIFRSKDRNIHKCDTVPTFTENKCSRSNADGEVTSFGACFAARDSYANWNCLNETQFDGIDIFATCISRQRYAGLPGNPAPTYDGACLFQGSPGYEEALTWGDSEVGLTSGEPSKSTDSEAQTTAEPSKSANSKPDTTTAAAPKSKCVRAGTGMLAASLAVSVFARWYVP